MIVCDFCRQYRRDGGCRLGLNIPKSMGCREFDPSMERFCSDPKDFVSAGQIKQMATFFGIRGRELKKVALMAAQEESARSQVTPPTALPPLAPTQRDE